MWFSGLLLLFGVITLNPIGFKREISLISSEILFVMYFVDSREGRQIQLFVLETAVD